MDSPSQEDMTAGRKGVEPGSGLITFHPTQEAQTKNRKRGPVINAPSLLTVAYLPQQKSTF